LTFLENLAILFLAYLTYLCSFQSHGGLKKLEQSVLLRLLVQGIDPQGEGGDKNVIGVDNDIRG